ncbi:MAG: hypothetical protein RR232_03675 [Clostridia bacterium]
MRTEEEMKRLTMPIRATVPQCAKCALFQTPGESRMLTCKAFPNGIPKELMLNKVDHFKENYPGDNGTLGKPKN